MTFEEARQVAARIVNEYKSIVWLAEMMEQADAADKRLAAYEGKKNEVEKQLADMDQRRSSLLAAAEQEATRVGEQEKVRLLGNLQSVRDQIATAEKQLAEKKQEIVGQQAHFAEIKAMQDEMIGQVHAERERLVAAYEQEHKEKRLAVEEQERRLEAVLQQIALQSGILAQTEQKIVEAEKKVARAKKEIGRLRDHFQQVEV